MEVPIHTAHTEHSHVNHNTVTHICKHEMLGLSVAKTLLFRNEQSTGTNNLLHRCKFPFTFSNDFVIIQV